LGKVFDPLVQGKHAVQARQYFVEWPRPAWRVFVVSHDEHIGKSRDLPGAFVDGLLDAVFGGGDLAFEAHAAVGAGFEVLEPVRGCEVFEQAGDEEARDFAELGHGVQGEEDAQEGQQELEHGWSMLSASGPVESGGLCPPCLRARSLNFGAKAFGHPTNPTPLHPPIRLSSRPSEARAGSHSTASAR
jgi:hypothetical protein